MGIGTLWHCSARSGGSRKACFRSESRSRENLYKRQSPHKEGFIVFGAPGGDLLSRGQSALSSAQRRFTVLFGMGRRGSTSLWPPSKLMEVRHEARGAGHEAHRFSPTCPPSAFLDLKLIWKKVLGLDPATQAA